MRITEQNLINIKPKLADFLSTLEVGDIVKGRILEILGENISIKTVSGQVFMAALMTDAELKSGQSIELIINDINENGVFAELKHGKQKTAKITEDVKLQQVLKQLDIKPEEENMQSARLLLKYNMPITKENINKLFVTQKSIETMAQGDAVKALSLMQSEQELSNTEFTKLAKQAAILEEKGKQVLKLIERDMPEILQNKNIELPQIEMPKEGKIKFAVEAKVFNEAVSTQSDIHPVIENTKQILNKLAGALDAGEASNQNNIPNFNKLIDTVVKVFETAAMAKPEYSTYLISKGIEVTPSALKFLIENVVGKEKLGVQLQKLDILVKELEQNGVDVKELKQEINKIFLKPEALQNKEQLQESLESMIKAADKLEVLTREYGMADKLDKSVLSELKGNIDFLKNINTAMNYIQIPLLINENKTTADLYVFSGNNRKKTINPENSSIVIVLDLKNLGHIESLIEVHKKFVKVTFKVERDEFRKLIVDSCEALKQSLEARGYTLNHIQVIDATERFNLFELEELTARIPENMHLDIKV